MNPPLRTPAPRDAARPGLTLRSDRIAFAAGFALVAAKLWLTRGQGLLAIGDSPGDDRLYAELAGYLVDGIWLGPYGYLTLAKNPGLPLWMAGMFKAGIPLLLSFQLLYAAACWAVTAAVRPALPRRAWGWALFVFLLWNPASFASQVATRASREGIYPALTLLVFAGLAGIVTRLGSSPTRLVGWAALLGAALASLLLTREEGIWILPMALVVLAAVAWQRDAWKRLALAVGVAVLVCALTVGGVLARNWRHYGEAVLNEQNQGTFPAAWGALSRVRHASWRRYVPLPRETRSRIYAASPLFAELAPRLEGPSHHPWVENSCRLVGVCDEAYSGLAFWEVRDAAMANGHLRTGPEASSYWSRLAAEVDGACDRGALDCDGPRRTMVPPWRRDYLPLIAAASWSGLRFVAGFDELTAQPIPSVGPLAWTEAFRDLSLERLSGLDMARKVRSIRGWAAAKDGRPLELRVVGPGSEPFGDAKGRHPRPEVEGWHRQQGWPDPAPAGFWLRAYCPSGCEVAIAAGGIELARLPLEPGRILETGALRAAIDEAAVEGVLPRQDRLDTRRLAVLDRVIRAYRAVTPALCLLALLAWLVALALALHRRWQGPTLWLLATGAGIGAATRIALLAAVDAMAFPGINPVYLSAAYPLLLLFLPLALAAGAASLDGGLAKKESSDNGGGPPASRP